MGKAEGELKQGHVKNGGMLGAWKVERSLAEKSLVGMQVKNGGSVYMVLAQEKNKSLLFRLSDGEVVIATELKLLSKEDAVCTWASGRYCGSYMNTVLLMRDGLSADSSRTGKDNRAFVYTTVENAGFLKSMGGDVYDDPYQAIADAEAEMRVNRLVPSGNMADLDGVRTLAADELYRYLLHDAGALGYDQMDQIVADVLERAGFVPDMDMDLG